MSYILDALKKAEQERAVGRVPGLGSEHEPAVRHTPRWLWVLLAVLALNALLLLLLLWPAGGPPPAAVDLQRDAAAPTAAIPAPAAEPVPEAPPPVAVQPATTAPQPASPPRPQTPPALPLRPLTPLPEPVDPAPAAVAASGGALDTSDAQAVTGSAYANLPVWPQIPGHLLGKLNGNLRLDVHVYSKVPAERFVLINMRKYRQGARLQEGPVVDEITPDSVILSLQGQRFRMQSQ